MFDRKSMHYITHTVFACAVVLSISGIAAANMSYTPWIHEMIQNETEMEITVSIFDEAQATNGNGEPIPDLTDGYTLRCISPGGGGTVFSDREFDPDEADEVTDKICHLWSHDYYEDGTQETACDDDSSCPNGFCAVAYRYTVTHHCPPFESDMRYEVSTTSNYDLNYEGESLGTSNWFEGELENVAECRDTGCSTTGVGNSHFGATLIGVLLALI